MIRHTTLNIYSKKNEQKRHSALTKIIHTRTRTPSDDPLFIVAILGRSSTNLQ